MVHSGHPGLASRPCQSLSSRIMESQNGAQGMFACLVKYRKNTSHGISLQGQIGRCLQGLNRGLKRMKWNWQTRTPDPFKGTNSDSAVPASLPMMSNEIGLVSLHLSLFQGNRDFFSFFWCHLTNFVDCLPFPLFSSLLLSSPLLSKKGKLCGPSKTHLQATNKHTSYARPI